MKRTDKYQDHKYFHFHNANNHNHYCGDCVVRAISTALNQTWEDTYKDMCRIGLKYGYMPNDDQTINKYLKQKGWVKMSEPRNLNNAKYMVSRYLREHGLKRAIANVGSHHIVAIIDNQVNDIWDSSSQTLHTYWVEGK